MNKTKMHRIYLRDWYFNAGIAGFLRLTEGIDIEPPHYIEFSNETFEGFEEKLKKEVFLTYFKIQPYLRKLKKAKEEIEKELQKTGKQSTSKKWIEILSKFPYRGMPEALGLGFNSDHSLDKLIETIDLNMSYFSTKTSLELWSQLQQNELGTTYLNYFITLKLKGFCSISGIDKVIQQVSEIDYSGKPLKPNTCCLSCQDPHRKADVELSNSVSNIIGFNKDNANWVWGYKSSNIKVCALCALIYISSIAGLTYTTYLDNGEWLDAYYFVNQSSSISALLNSTNLLKATIVKNRTDGEGETFYQLIKNMMLNLKEAQANSLEEGIHMIEVIQNPILGGQSSKGYNVFNYHLDKTIAQFLRNNISIIPKGYYKSGDTSIDLQMELLQKIINNRLTKSDLHRYTLYQIQELTKKKGNAKYYPGLGRVVRFIFEFWNTKEGVFMETIKRDLHEKGNSSGFQLRKRLQGFDAKDKKTLPDRINQIPGIAHSFLNSLKMEDKERFMDRYMRLSLQYNIPMLLTKEAMTNTDDFLQFGYAFLSGLIKDYTKNTQTEDMAS